jgi:hypothetical protein
MKVWNSHGKTEKTTKYVSLPLIVSWSKFKSGISRIGSRIFTHIFRGENSVVYISYEILIRQVNTYFQITHSMCVQIYKRFIVFTGIIL